MASALVGDPLGSHHTRLQRNAPQPERNAVSPEDQRVWEEDAESEYAEAHAQAQNATLGHADAEKVSQDVGEVEQDRVARWEFMVQNTATWWPSQKAEEAMRLADKEQAELVAENERMREAAEAHWDARTLECPGCGSGEEGCCVCSQMKRAESAESALAVARAQVEAVRALADEWEAWTPSTVSPPTGTAAAYERGIRACVESLRERLSSAAADTPEPASPDTASEGGE